MLNNILVAVSMFNIREEWGVSLYVKNQSLLPVSIAEVHVVPQSEPRRLHPVLAGEMRHLLPRHLRSDRRSRHDAGRLAVRGVGYLP